MWTGLIRLARSPRRWRFQLRLLWSLPQRVRHLEQTVAELTARLDGRPHLRPLSLQPRPMRHRPFTDQDVFRMTPADYHALAKQEQTARIAVAAGPDGAARPAPLDDSRPDQPDHSDRRRGSRLGRPNKPKRDPDKPPHWKSPEARAASLANLRLPRKGPQQPPERRLPPGDLAYQDEVRGMLRDVAWKLRRKSGDPEPPTKLVTLPGVSTLSAATRFIDGGRERFIEMVQYAVLNNEPLAYRWWQIYAALPPYPRSHVSFDDVCAASGVEPAALMGLVVSSAMRLGRDVGNFVAAMTSPLVIDAHVRSAQRIDGPDAEIAFKDRLAFLQGQGMLPVPKGAVINVHASANAQAAAAAATEPTVPAFSADLRALQSSQASPLRAIDAVPLPALPEPSDPSDLPESPDV